MSPGSGPGRHDGNSGAARNPAGKTAGERQDLTEQAVVRQTTPADFPAIIRLSAEVYGVSWDVRELASHLQVFPEGQMVAVLGGAVVGMSASLIVTWDDYEVAQSWRAFTDHGMLTNHDPSGRTLYGAEVMVAPHLQRRGIGHALYAARRALTRRAGLLRVRAGSRLRGFHRVRDAMTPQEYVRRVIQGELHDPTLSFQLREGFEVLAVVSNYLRFDDESHGWAAIIEWRNPDLDPTTDVTRGAF